MQGALSEQALRAAHKNEDAHTAHVTTLALRLFDGARSALRLTPADRNVMEVAATLHDIGFADCPEYHARYGARLILDKGLAGYTDRQRALTAAAVILHSGDWRRYLQHPIVSNLRTRKRALKLAAILRVADALDHAHIQDAAVRSVRRRGDRFHVAVCSQVYSVNAAWADRKADLWREFLPFGISFECLPRPISRPLFAGLVSPSDSVLETTRRILSLQYRTIRDNGLWALDAADPEYLHDIRVALRRFRACLRLFRPHLEGTRSRWLNAESRGLAMRLSPIRDFDVWLAFLRRKSVRKVLSNHPDAMIYVGRYRAEGDEYRERLRTILRGPEFNQLSHRMAYAIRAEPPFCSGHLPDQPFRPYVARRVHKLLRHILAQHHLTRKATVEESHALRRLVRRGRYWAEFAAPAFDPIMHTLAGRFKALADALGDVHDMDVFAERIGDDHAPAAKELARTIRRYRREYWKDFQKAWGRLDDKAFRKRAFKALDKAHHE